MPTQRSVICLLTVLIALTSGAGVAGAQHSEHYQVLLFTKSVSYPWRHSSISEGVQMFKELSRKHRFGLTWTDDSAIFDDQERLRGFDVVVFFHTSGDILDGAQKQAFQEYVRAGGNFLGIHGATFTMLDWPWYAGLVGALHDGHPGRQTAAVRVVDPTHPSTAHLPSVWIVTDEWYDFRQVSPEITVVLTVDESTYSGGKMPDHHPIAWYQNSFEGGRSYYTLLGHTEEVFGDPWFRQHIHGALWWAATGITLGGSRPATDRDASMRPE
jgi:type 1 glutamine amidotransferase